MEKNIEKYTKNSEKTGKNSEKTGKTNDKSIKNHRKITEKLELNADTTRKKVDFS